MSGIYTGSCGFSSCFPPPRASPRGPLPGSSPQPCGISLFPLTPRLHRFRSSLFRSASCAHFCGQGHHAWGSRRSRGPPPVTTRHIPRHCSSEASWVLQPRARPKASRPCPLHLQAFSFCDGEQFVSAALVAWVLARCCRGFSARPFGGREALAAAAALPGPRAAPPSCCCAVSGGAQLHETAVWQAFNFST